MFANLRHPGPRMRHASVFVISLGLLGLFSLVHDQWEPLHRWNRAFGDTALVLLALTLSLGPLATLFKGARSWLQWRRQTGIWTMVCALAHVAIILHAWVEWHLIRLFGFEFSPMFGRYIMHQQGFGLANVAGILALVFGLMLLLTSNDRSVRWLTPSVWQYLHRGAVLFWWLAIVHIGYFLFIHNLDVRRAMLDPNPMQWPFVALIVGVSALRIAASIQIWRQRTR